MWKFKHFTSKEQTGLEGRTIDIGDLKVQVRNAIAEGGFSSVYLARDAINVTKQYALKHIICNDEESLGLVRKEISIMKLLKGHPNVVTLRADAIFDMGRTMEALLLMDYCPKSLVNVVESRGAGFFEEKQVLAIFRDVCNAVFAMHSQSPPIAHRDLKAENLLLGSDGLWKLCDFGSTSTNHKLFEKPDEMGIEEDNIRKYTTPAYRAPEMWDLYRRELINEKVDIWALGCLLYRICYFKSAFDGESKLQVLNGNYRIPELPKYSSALTDLIRDMLQSSPDARPDITQVWFRVNDLVPDGLQKSLPDTPPEKQQKVTNVLDGTATPAGKPNPMPRRNPPPPPSSVEPALQHSKPSETGAPLGGAFWATQHAKDSSVLEDKTKSKFDEELTAHASSRHERGSRAGQMLVNRYEDGFPKDFEINLFPDDLHHSSERSRVSNSDSSPAFQGDAFNAFVAEFGNSKSTPQSKTGKEDGIEKLKEHLTQVNLEKAEMTSKYEKLSAICRSQRQEIQELKQTLAARTPSPNKDASRTQGTQPSTTPPLKEKSEGTLWELQQGLFEQSPSSSDGKAWQAFSDDPSPKTPADNTPRSVRTRNGHQTSEVKSGSSPASWGFGTDDFRAVPNSSPRINASIGDANNSRRFGEIKKTESKQQPSQPAGWAGF